MTWFECKFHNKTRIKKEFTKADDNMIIKTGDRGKVIRKNLLGCHESTCIFSNVLSRPDY